MIQNSVAGRPKGVPSQVPGSLPAQTPGPRKEASASPNGELSTKHTALFTLRGDVTVRKDAFGFALLALMAASGVAYGVEPPTYPCYQAPVPPAMDGLVATDPAWERIPAVTGFSKLGDGYTQAKQTRVQACWDAEALYIGVICEEPDVARMALHVRDGGPIWEDDGIEVFLMPGEGGPVSQFAVTAGGAKGGFVGAPDFRKFQAAAHTDAESYSLEIRIPFGLLKAAPKVGDRWRGDFCRNIWTTYSGGDKFTCWAPLVTQFFEPEHYATIVLSGPAPDVAQAQALTEQLNSGYRADLARRLRETAALGREYFPALAAAAGNAEYQAEALRLARDWRELRRVERQAGRAPLTSLRRTLKDADSLVQQSYHLKYAYLIATVLGD